MLSYRIASLEEYGRNNRISLYVEEVPEKHPEKAFHSHTFSELVLVMYGEAEHLVGEESAPIRKGDILILHPGAAHAYDKTSNFGIINLTYDCGPLAMPMLDGYEFPVFRKLFPSAGTRFSDRELCVPAARLPEDRVEEFCDMIRSLERELNSSDPGNFYTSMAMFMSIMAKIGRSVSDVSGPHEEPSRLDRVFDYISRNPTDPVTVDELAEMAKMSRRTFFRFFSRMTGRSPQEYRMLLKLKMGAELLKSSELSIGEISLQCGFCDSNHFCRVFRKYFKISPRGFRKKTGSPRKIKEIHLPL